MSSPDFYRKLEYVNITKADPKLDFVREGGVRLYCEQHGVTWKLQVRGQIKLAHGGEGKDFIVASASQSREDLIALRDAIDEALDAE